LQNYEDDMKTSTATLPTPVPMYVILL